MADSAADDAGGQNEAIELKETDLQKKLKSAKKASEEDHAKARAQADAKRAQAVSKSKQIADKFERLLQERLTTFFRIEVASIVLSIIIIIIQSICTTWSPALTFNSYPLAACSAIIVVAGFGASLLFFKNSFDKTQYIITGWFVFYVVVFLFAIVGQVFVAFEAVVSSITCSPQAIAANGPPLCLNPSLTGLVAFNCMLFFVLLSLRGITLWMGYILYQLLTKTKNAVVRATAKVDMRRSLSTRRRASFHSVDGSERINDPTPRKAIPAFAPAEPANSDMAPLDPTLSQQNLLGGEKSEPIEQNEQTDERK